MRYQAALIILLASTAPAIPHSARSGMPYDPWCCNAQDCAEIVGSSVTEVRGGYRVTLARGQHPMVKSESVTHFVALKDTKASDDGQFHACLYPDESTMRCFYAPPGGF